MGSKNPLKRRRRGNGRPGAQRTVSVDELAGILERHRLWVGSGWEMGQRADLRSANLRKADLLEAQLEWADLSAADLSEANLSGADLEDANLHGADLHRANLVGADLRWADLAEADITAADLEGGNLTDADLAEADLSGANLTSVKGLTQEALDAALGDASTRLPGGLTVGSGGKKPH